MDQPDIQKHAALLIGNQALELATARAVIEHLEKSLAEAKAHAARAASTKDE